jgi:hypothetical protein
MNNPNMYFIISKYSQITKNSRHQYFKSRIGVNGF